MYENTFACEHHNCCLLHFHTLHTQTVLIPGLREVSSLVKLWVGGAGRKSSSVSLAEQGKTGHNGVSMVTLDKLGGVAPLAADPPSDEHKYSNIRIFE